MDILMIVIIIRSRNNNSKQLPFLNIFAFILAGHIPEIRIVPPRFGLRILLLLRNPKKTKTNDE